VSGAIRHTKVEVDDERMQAVRAQKERDVINGQHISKVTRKVFKTDCGGVQSRIDLYA
jgi:hypothetical protein